MSDANHDGSWSATEQQIESQQAICARCNQSTDGVVRNMCWSCYQEYRREHGQEATPKVTKLPPAYPEGSNEGMARWTVKGGQYNQHGNVRVYRQHDEWAIGGSNHLSLLDAGGSLDPDTWGHPLLDWRPTLPPRVSNQPARHNANTNGILGEAIKLAKQAREKPSTFAPNQGYHRPKKADNGS